VAGTATATAEAEPQPVTFVAELFPDVFGRAAPAPVTGLAEIEIVHTNDMHGQVYPLKALWLNRDPAPDAGGVSAIASIVRKERESCAKDGAGFLLLDAGDVWQGTAEGNMTEGRVLVHWMNLVGYDAMAIGNHEFDAGATRIGPLAAEARFPWLSANLVAQDTQRIPDWCHSAVDRIVAGVKVSIVGITADDTKGMSNARNTRGWDFNNAYEAARTQVKAARDRGAEVVIVLSHCGWDVDRRIAATVPGVDAVIGGHNHVGHDPAFLDEKTGVLVAATYSKGSTVGRVRLAYDRAQKRVTQAAGRLIQVLTDEWPKDAATDALLEREAAAIHASMTEVLGTADAPLLRAKGGFESSPLGNWLCDVMRDAAKADVAVTNKTGIRADIPAGPVRMADIYQVSPFGNSMVSMLLTGRELRDELEYALSEPRYGLEVSGLEARYDIDRPYGDRVIRVLVGGRPLDLEGKYRVVTNSFLARGGDGHVPLTRGEDRRDIDCDVMRLHADDLKRRGHVKPAPEMRMGPAEETIPGGRG
jgi:2',3'-cyclic-nucleotide 2'-phosphodiesterase (5'-nucleotidase family)